MNELITVGSTDKLTPIRATFDFKDNKVEVMDLATLKRTHMEDDPNGNPQRGIYHFQAIENVAAICEKYSLNYAIEEIFAAQNKSNTLPGVTVLKKEAMKYGENAVEAHALRRIFTTIRIKDYDTDELTTTIVLTYHQDGIQAAIGPCVLICHNQCILHPDRMVSNYGKTKVTTEQLFETIDQWLSRFETDMTADRERIKSLKSILVSEQEIFTYIGVLTALRVSHDSKDKELSARVQTYPLTQTKINLFTEDALKRMRTQQPVTAWDLYNIATEYYKPDSYEIPSLIEQNMAFANTLGQFFEHRIQEAQYVEVA